MSRRARHTLGTQLSGAALGRVLSVDQAASMLGVDRGSIRRWMRDHPAADDWQIIQQMAGAQLVERVAKGLVRSSRDLAIILGVAGRNVRAQQLIARREQRREQDAQPEEPPEPNPIKEALDALDPARQRLIRDVLILELRRRVDSPANEPARADPDDQSWRELIADVAARTDAEVEAESARIRAELDATDPRVSSPGLPMSMAELPPTPIRPAAPVVARPASSPMVLDVGGRGEPWYDLETGERRRPSW